MTGRTPPEWVGKDADSEVPTRVKVRVYVKAESCCQICGVRVSSRGQIDHAIALANWKATPEAPHGNREGNLQHLCLPCHTKKTGRDVAEKALVYKKRKRFGPLARGEPKMKLSKKMDGTVCRWNPETRKYDIEV